MMEPVLITYTDWGYIENRKICLFTIRNRQGAYVQLTNYGATLVSVCVPDRNGMNGHAVLGFNRLDAYRDDSCYIGSTVGRFANRISQARCVLDGYMLKLEPNDFPHSNHGGTSGFHREVFDYRFHDQGVSFQLLSRDRSGGYPGNLALTVKYGFDQQNDLTIEYTATTDRRTPLNLTSHAYFNLAPNQDSISDHLLEIYASLSLENTADHVPTGRILKNAPAVFRPVNGHEKKQGEKGINRYYILDDKRHQLRPAGELREPRSGRRLEVSTTYPGLMLYTGGYLESASPGHQGRPYRAFDGLCLECHHYPDNLNHPEFPTSVLSPGKTYHEIIRYAFRTF
ncbi:MAG: galactose mutarotase [Mucilaginibacter polytrichastri]|nr:galactose mutarotase [Mucilaginibacter polytrichastri]